MFYITLYQLAIVGAKTTNNNTRKHKIREILEKYRQAGQISIEAKKLAKKICKPGSNAYEVSEKIENLIRSKGAKPAFPVNFSIDNEAAHYSPEILDDRLVPENSIVKIDLGAEIDGYIVDTAITLNFNPEWNELSKASKDALDAAIAVAKPGIKVTEIGKLVERIITKAGFEPIRNLSGHQIKRYNLHAGATIPNCGPGYLERNTTKLQAGRIYAIEPFASTGSGWVKNGPITNIFRFVKMPKKKDKKLYEITKQYKEKVGILPFSPRHLHNKQTGQEGKREVEQNIKKLFQKNIIMGYPVLIDENKKGIVSQHEHTIRVTRDGCEVLTSNEFN